ncbi:MAG: TrkH family potassium uptake protein [Candidatus Woesearchaeota archaeon]
MLIFAIFPIIPIVAALYYHESVLPFFAPVLFSVFLGLYLVQRMSKHGPVPSFTSFDIPRSISLSALSFVSISILASFPYMIIQRVSFLDALFESVSGFTTTGLTIFTDMDVIPRSLLLWRAETQWIGGLSILLLFLILVSALRHQESLKYSTTKAKAIATLYQAQGASERLEANLEKSMRNTILIYGGYTFIGIILLGMAGLSGFEALALSFTAISTAGFSVTNTFYTAWPVLGIVSLLMLAGGVSFVVHNLLIKGRVREVLKNRILRFYILTIVAGFAVVYAFVDDFKVSLFQTISAFTTTGFSITDLSAFPSIALLVLVFGMITGGMIGSTCGGIKTNRFKLMLKSIPWMVKKTAYPSGAIIPLKVDGMVVDDEQMLITQAFIACYFLLLFAGTAILLITGLSFLDSSFQMVSALGGVGLSTTSPAYFHPIAKMVLIMAMILGRLEIFPVLVLGKFFFDRVRAEFRKREEATRKLFYIRWAPSELWKRKL